jgi:phosphatidylserine/phosphatidylglycerophosphate/cardiolipin synthase-like enzyme
MTVADLIQQGQGIIRRSQQDHKSLLESYRREVLNDPVLRAEQREILAALADPAPQDPLPVPDPPPLPPPDPDDSGPLMDIYFSPKGGCTPAIVKAIGLAKFTIHVQAYSFTAPDIVAALTAAKARGVAIKILMDRDQSVATASAAVAIANAGLELRIDQIKNGLAHNKVMIIDGKKVLTGSFNFTRQAESYNEENLLVIRSPDAAFTYENNWLVCWSAGVPFDPNNLPTKRTKILTEATER